MLRKSFFTGAIMLITLLFGVTNSVSAGSVSFKFNKNPWNLTKVNSDDAPEKGKIEDNVEINQEGFILTNKKVNETKWNRLERDNYVIYKDNKITITAPAGKEIVKIEFQALNKFSFGLTNDEGIKEETNDDWFEYFEADANDPIVFKMKAQKATFTGGSTTTRLVYIEVVYKEVPVEEEPKKETTTTATFDFKNNFQTSWGIENVSFGTTNKLEGKIEDGKEVVQDGVVFTTVNTTTDKATRVKDGVLEVPPTHSFKLKAPEGMIISKVEFHVEAVKSSINPDGQAQLPTTNKVAIYTGTTQEANFTAKPLFAKITKMVITLTSNSTTGIAHVTTHLTTNNNVYNLNGVLVGTENTFNQLPKGVYIVNGKKVVKN